METQVVQQPEILRSNEAERVTLGLLLELSDLDSPLHNMFYYETGLQPTSLDRSIEPIGDHTTFVKKEFEQSLEIAGGRYNAGSFKLRGALLDALVTMTMEPETTRFVTASHGNHALGLAIAARYLGKEVEVHLPKDTHQDKTNKLISHGAKIVLKGYDTIEDSLRGAEVASRKKNVHFSHPFNDATVRAGQGTVLLETYWQLLAMHNDPHDDFDFDEQPVVVGLAVAGGGLYSGCQLALRVLRERGLPGANNIHLLGVQKEGCDGFMRCLEKNTEGAFNVAHFELGEPDATCDSTAVKEVGTNTLRSVQKDPNAIQSFRRVSNGRVAEAMRAHFGDIEGASEPAANLARAGLTMYAEELEKYFPDAVKPVLVDVMCGGPNVTNDLYNYYLGQLPKRPGVEWTTATVTRNREVQEKRAARFASGLSLRYLSRGTYGIDEAAHGKTSRSLAADSTNVWSAPHIH